MTDIYSELWKDTKRVTLDKRFFDFDFILKIIPLLFSIFSFFGFIILFLYCYKKGIPREALYYLDSFKYLFVISMFSIFLSLLVYITLSVMFLLSNAIHSDRYFDWGDNKSKNKYNSILLASFLSFSAIVYFDVNGLYVKAISILLVIFCPLMYLFIIRKKIKANDKPNFLFTFLFCYCVVVISQMQILIILLKTAEENELTVDDAFLAYIFIYSFLFIFYFNIENIGIKIKLLLTLFLISFVPVILNYMPNKTMSIIGVGDFNSSYIIKSDGDNIYEGLKLNIDSNWKDKKTIKLVDVYVVANLPKKIIVSSNEKDHIMYSIPKSSILSEVFGAQPNDKSQKKETQAINNSHG